MTRNCTQNDLIRLMYGEVDLDACTSIFSDSDVQEELVEVKKLLPQVVFEPSQASIRRILSFSKMTSMVTHLN